MKIISQCRERARSGYIGFDFDVKKEIRVNSVQFAFNF